MSTVARIAQKLRPVSRRLTVSKSRAVLLACATAALLGFATSPATASAQGSATPIAKSSAVRIARIARVDAKHDLKLKVKALKRCRREHPDRCTKQSRAVRHAKRKLAAAASVVQQSRATKLKSPSSTSKSARGGASTAGKTGPGTTAPIGGGTTNTPNPFTPIPVTIGTGTETVTSPSPTSPSPTSPIPTSPSPTPETTGGGTTTQSSTTSLKIGLSGFEGWGSTASETIRKATGVKYTRVSPLEVGWAPVRELVGEGITPLLLYDPHMAGMSPAAVAEGVKSYVAIMHELHLTELELGNEVYYNGSTPAEYAAQYRAAHEALAGSGITLIANAWTDTQEPDGEWSQWEAGGGWCVMFVDALGYVPDAWSFHPYGPMSADGFGSGANQQGWATVPRMIAYMKADHVYAPLDITEVGQPTYEGTDGNPAVSEAQQAADVRQYLTQAAEWGLASIYLYEAVDTAEGGYGLYSWPLKAKPSAAVFAETLAKLTST